MNSFTDNFKKRACYRFYCHTKAFINPYFSNLSKAVLVALSGGRDSVATLYFMKKYCQIHNLELRAIHINHGQRNKSELEQIFVQSLCENLNVELVIEKYRKKPKSNIEATLRDFRYSMFEKHLKQNELCILGHHLDDSYEWSMLRAFKSGELPLGIPVRNGIYLRPFLCVSRAQITAFLREMDANWCEDQSNMQDRFERNFLRKQIRVIKKRFPKYLEKYVQQQTELVHLMQLRDQKLNRKIVFSKGKAIVQTSSMNKEEIKYCLKKSIQYLTPNQRSSMGKELDKYSRLVLDSKHLDITLARKLRLQFKRPTLTISTA